LLFLVINYLAGRFTSKSARPVVAPEPYPVQNTGIKDVTR